MAVGRAGRVDLDIEAEGFGEMRDLHRPGDADVEVGIGADEVGSIRQRQRRHRLEAADMLAQQERRLDQLAQAAMGMGGKAAVTVGILVPEETGIVAGSTASKRVREGPEMAGGVVHQRHAPADPLSKQPDRRGVPSVSPSVQPCILNAR